jgi:hypothetical protein
MFTVMKVREGIVSYDDPGWYKHPEGTVAGPVSDSEIPKELRLHEAAPATNATPEKK